MLSWITERARLVVALAAIVVALGGVVAAGAMDALSLSRYETPGSESVAARDALDERFGVGTGNVAVLVTPAAGHALDDPRVAEAGLALAAAIAADEGVVEVQTPWDEPRPAALRSEDGAHGLLLVRAPGTADHVRTEVLPRLAALVEAAEAGDDAGAAGAGPAVAFQLGGGDEVFRVVAQQARTDFLRAEALVVPLILVLLWAYYRRIGAAVATLAVGLVAVVLSLAVLRGLAAVVDISTFAANIVLVMGIGLGVDYGMLAVARYREERVLALDARSAARATAAGAGRTIVFSGATVAAALAVLFALPVPFLASFAYAGIVVVAAAVLGATVLLPAMLALWGDRMVRPAEAGPIHSTRWYRFTSGVLRRPVVAGVAGLAVVLLLGAPALATQLGAPDDRVLTSEHGVRDMYDTIRADFAAEAADAIAVVTAQPGSALALDDYAAALSRLDGVARVDGPAGAFVAGERIGEAAPGGAARFSSDAGAWFSVLPTADRLQDDPVGLVAEIRALDAPVPMLVGGSPAELADYRAAITDRLPLILVLLLGVTALVLLAMTGSIVAAVKAIVLNLLSLSVLFGVSVVGFQFGAFAPLLGFEPTGTLEPSILLLTFCVAYALSMDYEVFLLARIQEAYDRTGDPRTSIAEGIARSGPLVTGAAIVLAVSFAVYATSSVTFLQQIGLGVAVTILVDATLIRGLLVPAAMRLAGRANWWAPAPLDRLRRRLSLHGEPSATDCPATPAEPTAAPAREPQPVT